MEVELLEEQKKTNELLQELLTQEKRKNELLTIEQVHEEYDIGINTVRKMFADEELAVQRYTVPFKVARSALEAYMSKSSHDYLCERRS